MAFTVKLATYDDLVAADAVERETMGDYVYLQDAWHYFNSLDGGLVCVYDGDKMIGIGRFTVLPDGTGWLETLRVIPSYHRQGAGRKIYEKYVELAKQYNCPSMAMFTGLTNVASSGLAEVFGLRTVMKHKGWHLTDLEGGNPHGFKHVNWQRAVELILPLKEQYNDYFTFNRTFHHVNEANAKQFAIEGKVFEDKEKLLVRISGTELYRQLSEFECFYHCGRAHIINLNHISRITQDGVIFKNETKLLLPHSVLTGLRSAFFDYFN